MVFGNTGDGRTRAPLVEYLGQLKQRSMIVYVWKVSSPGAKEDVLVELGMRDGKASMVQAQ